MTLTPGNESQYYLSIQKTPYGGRGYFANCDIPKNTVVLCSKQPFCAVIFKSFKKEVCAYCFSYDNGKTRKFRLERPGLHKSKTALAAYAGVYFCTDSCRSLWSQELDFDASLSSLLECIEQKPKPRANAKPLVSIKELIKKHAPKFDRIQPNVLQNQIDSIWQDVEALEHNLALESLDDPEYDNCRLLVHALVNVTRAQTSPHLVEDFGNLQSNEIFQLCQFPFLLESHIKVYLTLKRCLPSNNLLNSAFVRQTLGKEAGNAFGIWELPMMSESECFGTAIHPAASFFNHECSPTVTKRRDGRSMVFTTCADIRSGDQLFISYGMMDSLPLSERQDILQNQWFFKCLCTRCQTENTNENENN